MDYFRGWLAIPIILAIGIAEMVTRRVRPETTEQYLRRIYPDVQIREWTDGT